MAAAPQTADHSSAHGSPFEPPRHLKVTGAGPAFGYEPCEDPGCAVTIDGSATSCGRTACPACGCGGTNLRKIELIDAAVRIRMLCTCGYSWMREERHSRTLAQLETVR